MVQINGTDLDQQSQGTLPYSNVDAKIILTTTESTQPVSPATSDIITVVRDPRYTLGKGFSIKPDGTISKKSSVNVSFGIATQHQINTPEDFAKLLQEVGEDSHAAIINAYFPEIPVGEEFFILSARELEQRTGIPKSDRDKQKGVHEITHDGKTYKAVGRFKENVLPSSWQYLDRDIDKHTPNRLPT